MNYNKLLPCNFLAILYRAERLGMYLAHIVEVIWSFSRFSTHVTIFVINIFTFRNVVTKTTVWIFKEMWNLTWVRGTLEHRHLQKSNQILRTVNTYFYGWTDRYVFVMNAARGEVGGRIVDPGVKGVRMLVVSPRAANYGFLDGCLGRRANIFSHQDIP